MEPKKQLPIITLLNLYKVYTLFTSLCALSALTCEMYSLTFLTLANGCEFELTGAEQYLAMAIPAFGMLASGQLWNYIGEGYGRKRTLYAAIKAALVFNIFCIVSTDFKKYVFFKLLSSTCVSGTWRMSKELLSDFFIEAKRYVNMLANNAVILLTCGILTGLTWLIVDEDFYYDIPHFPFQLNSWRLMYLISCVPTFICNILARLLTDTANEIKADKSTENTCEILHHEVELAQNVRNETLIRSLMLRTKFLMNTHTLSCLRKCKPQDPYSRTRIEKKYANLICFLFSVWLLSVFSDVLIPLLGITYVSVPYEETEPNKTVCEIVGETFINPNFTFHHAFKNKIYIPNACSKLRLQADPDIYIFELNLHKLAGYGCLLALINTIVKPLFNFVFVQMDLKLTILTFTIGKKCFYGAVQIACCVVLNSIDSSSSSYKIGSILLVYIMCVLTLCILDNYKLHDFNTSFTGMSAIMILMSCFGTGGIGDRLLTDLKSGNCDNVLTTYAGICFAGIVLTIFLPAEMEVWKGDSLTCKNYHTTIIKEIKPKDIELGTNHARSKGVKKTNAKSKVVETYETTNAKPKVVETTNTDPKDVETTNANPKDVETANANPKDVETTNVQLKDVDMTNAKPKDIETTNAKPKEEDTTNSEPKDVDTTNAEAKVVETTNINMNE